MRPAEEIEKFIENVPLETRAGRDREVLEDVLKALEESKEHAERQPNNWKARMEIHESFWERSFANPFVRKVAFHFTEVVAIVVLTLSVSHWFGFPRSGVPGKPIPEIRDDSATINFYLREHQGVVARTASLNLSPPQPARMRVSRHDVLYYEFFDDQPEFIRPGIIVRGPSSQRKVIPPEAPAISNGHTLTLSQARKTVNFDLVSPPWLYPGYMLDKIRRIEDRDALHLLYTDGINTLSLFEQPLDGERGLAAQDFREYAVYRNKGQAGGAILAWRDDALSYVLIGNAEMSQLMNMAQSISAAK